MNEDFRYIAAIAEHGSISKAARMESISQPALSQRLKRLESRLGCNLFDRSTQPLIPTEIGEVVIGYARRAIAAESDMRRDVTNALNNRRRRLRIGVSMPRANALLAIPIVEFHELYHGCTIELREMTSFEGLHNAFLTDNIDFALATPILPDSQYYEVEVLCREKLVVAVSEKLKVPALEHAGDSIRIGQLEGIPFVLPTCGQYFDPIISHLIDRRNVQLDVVVRDCDAQLALSLIEDGMGAAIVPSTYVVGKSSLRTFNVADVNSGNTLRYIRQQGKPASVEEQRFIGIVHEHVAAYGL